ncbi:MAG: hypothetical protein PHR77_04650 [Kiritimatiellae bacterium]|nr:hypothetical protein [Kiritimatiellia bacterium]MDD5519485.1 hypothetical protein [Kiritimatiellia bacterium]
MKLEIKKITEVAIDRGQDDIYTSKVFKVVVSDGCSTTTVRVGFLNILPAGIIHNEVITKRIHKEADKSNSLEKLPTDIQITSADLLSEKKRKNGMTV